jgi:hypothetical protein
MGTESRIQAATPSGLIHESPQTLNETRTTIIDELAFRPYRFNGKKTNYGTLLLSPILFEHIDLSFNR